jgi:ABC-type polysaccharide/polyol phosphate transport system ATPase subunit
MEAVVVTNATKTYRRGIGRARIREMLPVPFSTAVATAFPKWWKKDTFNALDDVTFTIESGQSVGVVGHNGAGKTTLLKVVSRVTAPTSGKVFAAGRVAALIDVLVGFHPELSGLENIELVGAMQGYSRKAMVQRVPQILEFAEIDELAATPVKRYSAGMISRLGFGTLTSLELDTIMVDEVLSVGDAAFQRKCIQWLEDFKAAGGTLVFVSHNLGLVRNMTERALWFDHGKLIGDGTTKDVLADYAKAMERRQKDVQRGRARNILDRGLNRWGIGGAVVQEVHMNDAAMNGGGLEITINYESTDLQDGLFAVGFVDESGREVGAAASPVLPMRGGTSVRCVIKPLPFRTGIYFPVVAILSSDGKVRDRWRLDRAVVVDRDGQPGVGDFGPVDIAGTWS